LASGLHGRNRWRLPVLLTGILFAVGRRTVSSWLRAAGVSHDFQDYYYFLAPLGRKTKSVATRLFLLLPRTLPLPDQLPVILDGSPTKRYGPKVEGADKSPFLKRALATGTTVIGRLRKDAALRDLPRPLRRTEQRGRGRPRDPPGAACHRRFSGMIVPYRKTILENRRCHPRRLNKFRLHPPVYYAFGVACLASGHSRNVGPRWRKA
jgi:hypothetical protein